MPSPRSRRPLRPLEPVAGRAAAALGFFVLALTLSACASSAPPKSTGPLRPISRALDLPAEERAFLVDPFAGYSGVVDPARHDAVAAAHDRLLTQSDFAGAETVALELLAADPQFAPAEVLAAAVRFARGDLQPIIRRLLPIGDRHPDYTASQLLLGRAAERMGDIALAYAAYRAVAARSPLAFGRTGVLHAEALETVRQRLDLLLEEGKAGEAAKQLALLESWGPSELHTFEAAAAVARATGDLKAELSASRKLSERLPEDRPLLERRADLEMEVGDPSQGLEIVQALAERHPKDAALANKLEVTKFRWRLSFLPPDVRELARQGALSRGELAVLLFWLVPNVRYAKPTAGLIAEDVLEEGRQEEIIRVVNLGLMDVDSDLHRFSPGAGARRSTAISACLRLLARFGGGLACSKDDGNGVCSQAARCGLIGGDDCRPRDPISGLDAVEMIRRTLKRLGAS